MEEKTKRGKVWQTVASFGAILAGAILAFAVAKAQNSAEAKMIVATNFPAYEFAREIVGAENVRMLVPAGTDLHHYEPSPADLKEIAKAKLLVYNGGEAEVWVEKLLADFKGETFKMMDATLDLITDDTDEIDEHIWTSPKNALRIVAALKQKIIDLDPKNRKQYEQNADNYLTELEELDKKLTDLVAKARRSLLAFGDRYPFAYLVRDYGLTALSALPACAEETEPDSKTMAKIIETVKNEKLPIILKLEQSASNIAETIAKETGAEIRELNSFHEITKADFGEGKTYLDFSEDNLKTLEAALNNER